LTNVLILIEFERSKKMNKRGVTLIELVVVFVIIAVLAVLMVPNIGAWLPGYRLRTATREVVSTLRTAQMRAVSTNTAYGVGFGANSCQLYRGTTAEGAPINLPSGVQFINNTFPVNGTLGQRYAQFNPDSTSSGGGVTLQNTKGAIRRIDLTTATGRANVT
jgi:prepilin-type N-terminal cleavage/methylation domain-containing protein